VCGSTGSVLKTINRYLYIYRNYKSPDKEKGAQKLTGDYGGKKCFGIVDTFSGP
jgi:hypothetical protein